MAGKGSAGDHGDVTVAVFGADRLVQFDGVGAVNVGEVDIQGDEVGLVSTKLGEGVGRIGSDSEISQPMRSRRCWRLWAVTWSSSTINTRTAIGKLSLRLVVLMLMANGFRGGPGR
jgi:hypothetical protein